jgi:hypothetical protein
VDPETPFAESTSMWRASSQHGDLAAGSGSSHGVVKVCGAPDLRHERVSVGGWIVGLVWPRWPLRGSSCAAESGEPGEPGDVTQAVRGSS